jgi:hypothetical protein
MYTVSRLGPAARIVPSLLDLAVMTAAVPAPELLAAGAYELCAEVAAG